MNHALAKTAFLTSIIAYGAFLLFEYLRPGFVQFVFSVHWFLVAVVLTGAWWAMVYQEETHGRLKEVMDRPGLMILGILLMVVLLREGQVFGDFRIVIGLVGLVLPTMIGKFIK